MSWFRKHRPPPEKLEGAEALKRTKDNGVEVRKLGHEVDRLARSIKNLREENHFAESIANLLKGHKP